ncbi:hypothetical protein P7C70_g6628, partial [Phenoliferia sp. Uapishka_3]
MSHPVLRPADPLVFLASNPSPFSDPSDSTAIASSLNDQPLDSHSPSSSHQRRSPLQPAPLAPPPFFKGIIRKRRSATPSISLGKHRRDGSLVGKGKEKEWSIHRDLSQHEVAFIAATSPLVNEEDEDYAKRGGEGSVASSSYLPPYSKATNASPTNARGTIPLAHLAARQNPVATPSPVAPNAAFTVSSLISVASVRAGPSVVSQVNQVFGQAVTAVSNRNDPPGTTLAGLSSAPSQGAGSSGAVVGAGTSGTSSQSPSSASPSGSSSPVAAGNHSNLALIRKVVPAVIIPIAFILFILLLIWLLRRRSRQRHTLQSPTFGFENQRSPSMFPPRDTDGHSSRSFDTTDSAIGVAYGGPRTRWGRRSLVDVLAGSFSGNARPRGSGGSSSSFGHTSPSMRESFSHSVVSVSHNNDPRSSAGVYSPGQPRPFVGYQHDEFGSPTLSPPPRAATGNRQSDISERSEWTQSSDYTSDGDGTPRIISTRPLPPPVPTLHRPHELEPGTPALGAVATVEDWRPESSEGSDDTHQRSVKGVTYPEFPMPDTDYEDISLEAAPSKAKRGATYGKRARTGAGATAKSGSAGGSASTSASAKSKQIERGRKEARKERGAAVAQAGKEEREDADSESAGEGKEVRRPKRARKSTSLADVGSVAVLKPSTTTASLRLSLSNPAIVKLPLASTFSKPPAPKSKRSPSSLTSRPQRSKSLRAPTNPTSPKNEARDAKAEKALMRVGGGSSSESEEERRARKKGKKVVKSLAKQQEEEGGQRQSEAGNASAMEIDEPPDSRQAPVDEPASYRQAEEASAGLGDATSTSINATAINQPHLKPVLGDKSNLPSVSRAPPNRPIDRARSATQAREPTLIVPSPRRHSSLGRGRNIGRTSETLGSSRIQVFRDNQSSNEGPRDGGGRAVRSGTVAAPSGVAVQPSAVPSQATLSMDLQALSFALPTASRSSSPAPIHPSRVRDSTSSNVVPHFGVREDSEVPLNDGGLDYLDLDEEEVGQTYRPPTPREGSVIPHTLGGMDSSIIIESYDSEERNTQTQEIEFDGNNSFGGGAIEAEVDEQNKSAELDDVDVAAESSFEISLRARSGRPSLPPVLPDFRIPETPEPIIPPRRPRASVDCPISGGPGSDEDDLAYVIRTTATGEDSSSILSYSDDEKELARNGRELGKSWAPGGRIEGPDGIKQWGKSRRSRFLRQTLETPIECEEGGSDDELKME